MSISSTLVHRADIRFHEAPEALRPFVGCFWVITVEAGATIRVVPDGSSAISIELRDGRPAQWRLRGPLLRPEERRFESPATLVGIRLRAGVATLLSGIPAHTMVDRRIGLDGVAPFHDLVSAGPPDTPERCLDVLRDFLLRRLEHASPPAVVAAALHEIERAHGSVSVADVAVRCGVSTRHLHRLMREWIGYGTKRYASVIRFQATLHDLDRTPSAAPAALASGNGYFDQSHLTFDLSRFAGATPGRLAAAGVADFSKTRCDDLA